MTMVTAPAVVVAEQYVVTPPVKRPMVVASVPAVSASSAETGQSKCICMYACMYVCMYVCFSDQGYDVLDECTPDGLYERRGNIS